MLTNAQMIEGRYLRWAKARAKVAWIVARLNEGREVYICTATRATKLSKKHIEMVRAAKNGAYMQSGRKWVCIDYCQIEAH